MRTRHRRPSRIPEVNLVPMMDVLMTVLIFFVVISMGLTGVEINGVTLPRSVNSTDEIISGSADESPPFVIGLTAQKELILDDEIIQLRNLSPRLRTYFQENPDGTILLKADRTLPYDDIANLLDELRGSGGRRVSLAVE
ncbi:transport energizing protein, ExbD/TolR family [Synechococcus sp. PCC 7335]|uniref:ExbD/TolR family protein n=1 Tax=Synechococcus sp. (strain ATCC 29403 / PCC 7335) TaxID=91464 RepID=UPI00017EBBFC|nr:biopolymer transporter ExbD [Synechococcus sp. PCC 7335]EDX83912.1 transport energizing protein, ExbD/TolR family [Synechococcus sp. PCC 7335]